MSKMEREPRGSISSSAEGGEIRIAHAPHSRPVTAVKNVLLQASLARLKETGLYPRYAAIVAPGVPEQIESNLAMSWMPVEVAVAHYGACESMVLDAEQVTDVGTGVGERVKETQLVTSSKKTREEDTSNWDNMGSLYRIWARSFQGGSVQIVKLGAKDMLLEQRGFVLTQYRYYRQAQLAVLRSSFEAFGMQVTSLKTTSYSAARDEVAIRLTWV